MIGLNPFFGLRDGRKILFASNKHKCDSHNFELYLMNLDGSDATHWSVRAMATAQNVSPATVQRIWKKHKLQTHRVPRGGSPYVRPS